ncbi:MAG: hypothetical protein MUC96_14020 [Myxococcaceae bacterium]|jgi:hypothetical protein|nr:hypothetical protein [Myxococcaceae bacterium]
MAKPPEPLADVLPQARWVVDAEVIEVVASGPTPPRKDAPPGSTSVGNLAAAQTVKLAVKQVLRGDSVRELVVEKPAAGYALKPGDKGPFLVDANMVILGRYGPDSWHPERIAAALKG